jgi:hypothetical protein
MRRYRFIQPAALLIAAGFLTALAVGCSSGPARGEVKGKVTFKGKPVTEGIVTFLNPKGEGDAEAQIGQDGTFTVPGGVVVGEYIVVITPPIHIVDTDPGKSPPAPVEKNMPNIPRKYRQQGSTPLRASVKEGQNDFTFDMTP